MKGKMKKLVAFALATIMVMAMGITAFAANEGNGDGSMSTSKVTIDGTTAGTKYDIYKIFNVIPNGDVVSYVRPESQPLVGNYTGVFTEAKPGNGNLYYNPEKGLTESKLVTYLSATQNVAGLSLESIDSVEATGTKVELSLTPGYYYIVSDKGANVILRAVADEPVTISEKNNNPNWGDGGKKSLKWNAKTEKWEEGTFYKIGETVRYEVNYNAAQNYAKEVNGNVTTATKVYRYVAEDIMPAGVKIEDETTIKVTVNGKDPVAEVTSSVSTNGDGRDVVSITIPWAKSQDPKVVDDFYYSVPATIKITYDATVKENVNAGEALKNEIVIDYNEIKEETKGKDNDIYTGSLQVLKYDGTEAGAEYNDDTKLAGAKFVIIDTATVGNDTKYLHKAADGTISWGAKDGCLEITTGSDGKTEVVKGLEQDIYYLLEIEAPNGYNLAVSPIAVEIAKNKTVDDVQKTDLVIYPEIGNNKGTLLPSTGGIGTTIFYVVGGILVVAAGILLITKKRMGKNN